MATETPVPPVQIADHVVRAAAQLFRRKGYAATTTRELAAHLGIQKASLYYYITSKEDLLYAICTLSLKEINLHVRTAYEATPSRGKNALRRAIIAHIETLSSDRDLHATMLQNITALSPERHREVARLRKEYERFFRAAVSDAFSRRAEEIPADLRALYILGAMNWSVFWYDAGRQHGTKPADIGETLAKSFGI